MALSYTSDESIKVYPVSTNHQQRTSQYHWHDALFSTKHADERRNTAPAEALHDMITPAAAAPRARRSSLSAFGSSPSMGRASPRGEQSRTRDDEDSSIAFDVISAQHDDAEDGDTLRPSTILFEEDPSATLTKSASPPKASNVLRHKPASSSKPASYTDPLSRLYHVGLDRKLARQQWACMERAKLEQLALMKDQCSFRPELSPLARSIERPKELSPANRAASEACRRRERLAKLQAAQLQKELDACTFKPLTLSAAKLHASALIRRSDIHEELFADDKKRRAFRDDVQGKVVKVLERRFAKAASVRPTAADTHDDESAALTKEEVDAIVFRLLNASIRHAVDDPATRGETFHPKINPVSEQLAEVARQRRETRAALTQDAGAPADGAEVIRRMKDKLAGDRRHVHARLLFEVLADFALEQQRMHNDEAALKRKRSSSSPPMPPPAPPQTSEVVEVVELTPSVLQQAADTVLPCDSQVHTEVSRAISICTQRFRLHHISCRHFSHALLNFTSFTSFTMTHRQPTTQQEEAAAAAAAAATLGTRKPPSSPVASSSDDHEAVVQRLLLKQRRALEQLEDQRLRRANEQLEEEMRDCTFHPEVHAAPARPNLLLTASHNALFRDVAKHDAGQTNTIDVGAVKNKGDSAVRTHHTLHLSEPCGARLVPHPTETRRAPSLPEEAAIGGSRALRELGTQWMREQLASQDF